MKTTSHKTLLLLCNLLLALLVLAGWLVSLLAPDPDALLISHGLANLRYFTVLSNLLEGAAAVVMTVCLCRGRVPHGVFLMKFLAAVTVAVTFFVVALFFGPWVGWAPLYRRGNFFYHLVVPLLAMIEFILWDRFGRISRREVLLAPLPALAYGAVYAVSVLLLGGEDFYGFVHWGLPAGFGIFAGILLLSWGSGALLRLGNQAGRRK